MALDIAGISSPLGTSLITITQSDATADNNIMSGSATIQLVEIDNSLNANEAVYVKCLDGNGTANNNAVDVGTDAPHHIWGVPQGQKRTFLYPEGMGVTKLNVWATKEAGTAGTTSPQNPVRVEILVS